MPARRWLPHVEIYDDSSTSDRTAMPTWLWCSTSTSPQTDNEVCMGMKRIRRNFDLRQTPACALREKAVNAESDQREDHERDDPNDSTDRSVAIRVVSFHRRRRSGNWSAAIVGKEMRRTGRNKRLRLPARIARW